MLPFGNIVLPPSQFQILRKPRFREELSEGLNVKQTPHNTYRKGPLLLTVYSLTCCSPPYEGGRMGALCFPEADTEAAKVPVTFLSKLTTNGTFMTEPCLSPLHLAKFNNITLNLDTVSKSKANMPPYQ